VLHRDFVSIEEISGQEDVWLRLILQEHLDRTGSPRAARLLSRRGPLPMLRVQPIHLQGTVEDTWQPVLAKLSANLAIPIESQQIAASHAVSV
jgi:hypothetical protein